MIDFKIDADHGYPVVTDEADIELIEYAVSGNRTLVMGRGWGRTESLRRLRADVMTVNEARALAGLPPLVMVDAVAEVVRESIENLVGR